MLLIVLLYYCRTRKTYQNGMQQSIRREKRNNTNNRS